MGSFVITPSTGSTVTFTATPDMGSAGKYWLSKAELQRRVHGMQKHPVPGQPGIPNKWHGLRTRDLENIEVIYVAAAADTAVSTYDTDDSNLAGKTCSLSIFGLTVPACVVTDFRVIKGPKKTGSGGMYRLHCRMSFQQLRSA